MEKPGLVAKPIVEARTRHHLAPSRISAPLVRLGRCLIPVYFRFVLHFQKIEIRHPEQIIEALRDFQEKRTRLIVAFRHPYGDEPQLVFHVFNNLLPRWAKRHRTPLPRRPLLRIVHDYAVPLWGDAFIRFLLPRIGAVPVYHVKFDPESLKQIRSILLDDSCPLGLAPEGQISYHSETLPRIEQGAIRMGFWCARDLEKAGRPERVNILPLSIHYRYDLRDAKKIQVAITHLETLCGLCPSPIVVQAHSAASLLADLQTRTESIENRVLDIAEDFYAKTCNYRPKPILSAAANNGAARQQRWEALLKVALVAAEHMFGLVPNNADIIQRVYRIRQEGWDRIYPMTPVDQHSPLESALAHRQAGEAWFAMRHMEFVDLMFYHDSDYLQGGPDSGPSFDRIVETVINFQDLVARLMGGNITNRPNVIRKKAVLVPAPCLDLTSRLPDYHKNTRQAADEATDILSNSFKDCIKEYLHETKH
jgi:hypothetical protein